MPRIGVARIGRAAISRILAIGLARAALWAYSQRMGAAVFNLVIGVAMLLGGASGKLALLGTSSSGLLAVLGGVVAALGLYQLVTRLRGR